MSVEVTEGQQWPAKFILVDGQVVLPIMTRWKAEEIVVLFRGRRLTLVVRNFAVELGFAITYHKVQGQTLEKVIVDVSKRPFLPHVDYHGFYVAISRVRHGSDLRIIPPACHGDDGDLDHLLQLKPWPELTAWLSAFDTEGNWAPAHANTSH